MGRREIKEEDDDDGDSGNGFIILMWVLIIIIEDAVQLGETLTMLVVLGLSEIAKDEEMIGEMLLQVMLLFCMYA